MSKFIIRRVFLAAIIILFGAFIVYAVIRALPSSYVETIARQRATVEAREGIAAFFGRAASGAVEFAQAHRLALQADDAPPLHEPFHRRRQKLQGTCLRLPPFADPLLMEKD